MWESRFDEVYLPRRRRRRHHHYHILLLPNCSCILHYKEDTIHFAEYALFLSIISRGSCEERLRCNYFVALLPISYTAYISGSDIQNVLF